MKKLWKEFREFAASGDLVKIAVAFIIGLAIKALVDSFVKDIFMGTVGLFVDCTDIVDDTGKKIGEDCTGLTGEAYKSLAWGNFVNSVINFLLIVLVVFWIVKVYEAASKKNIRESGPSEVDLLVEIRDELRSQRQQ